MKTSAFVLLALLSVTSAVQLVQKESTKVDATNHISALSQLLNEEAKGGDEELRSMIDHVFKDADKNGD